MSADSVAQDQLQAFVRRIESLEDEITALNGDKSEVYKEAKGNGFDTKVLRKVIADRRKDATERNEFDAVYQLYWDAVHGIVRAHVEIIEEFDPETGEIGPAAPAWTADAQPANIKAAPIHEPEAAMLPQTAGSETAVATEPETTNGGRHETAVRSEPSVKLGADDKIDDASEGISAHDVEGTARPAHVTGEQGDGNAPNATPAESVGISASNSRRMSMTPLEPREAGGLKGFGFTVRFDEPAPLTQGVAAVGGGSANHPVASAAVTIADQSKPNPICRDPGDCGVYASWAMPCEACKAAAAHRSAA